jgi:hypothetical protein
VDKSYAKKRQRGSSNSYIKQILSTSGTATNKNKEIPALTSGTATNKNKEIAASTLGTSTNTEQVPSSTTDRTNLLASLSAEAQKVIDNMSADELAQVIYFYE